MRGGIDLQGVRTYGNGVPMYADNGLQAIAGTDNREAVIGKAVTLVAPVDEYDEYTVGYGSDGDPLFGVIKQYEYDGCVTIDDVGYVWVPGTANVGDVVVVDGNGGVRAEATLAYGPKVVAVDSAKGRVMVRLG